MRVKDVMTRQVLWLDADAPISAAAWTMAAEFISGAPVRDHTGKLVGVFSNTDVTTHLNMPQSTKVSELMHAEVASVNENALLEEAIDLLIERGIHRLVVTDGTGAVVGVVTALDVLRGLR